jgi:hypothetical protein
MSLLVEYRNTLSHLLCNDIINLFEKYKNDNLNYFEIPKKNSVWNKIEILLYRELLNKINNYKNTIMNDMNDTDINNIISILNDDLYLNHFLIQKFDISDIKKKIKNNNRNNSRYNILTFILFLNNIESGGEFISNDTVIKSEKGKLIIFSDKNNYEFISPISDVEYIISGEISIMIE